MFDANVHGSLHMSQAGAVHDGLTQRHLIWSETPSKPCSADRLNHLQLFDPTIYLCLDGTLQWDKSGLFIINYIFTNGYIDSPFVNGLVPSPFFQQYAYYNGQQCRSFDSCSILATATILHGQYTYDCSNVYCGNHAKRDCNGNFAAVACPAGVSPPPEIPSYADVSCDVHRQQRTSDPVTLSRLECTECGVAQAAGETTPAVHAYSCDRGCVGCFEQSGRCILSGIQDSFGEVASSFTSCAQFTDTQDTSCSEVTYGPTVDFDDGTRRPAFSSCSLRWNDEECECNICGFNEATGLPKARADCSAVAGENSVNDECTNTYTGVFAVFNENLVISTDPLNDACGRPEGSAQSPDVSAPSTLTFLSPLEMNPVSNANGGGVNAEAQASPPGTLDEETSSYSGSALNGTFRGVLMTTGGMLVLLVQLFLALSW